MSKKSVGIITLPGNYNYGNRLQCYAMADSVERIGCRPSVLEREASFYWYRRAYYAVKLKLKELADRSFVRDPELVQTPERAAAFKRFAERIPIVRLPGMGYKVARESYDSFVVGSDQVWNPRLTCHQEAWYYAMFAQPDSALPWRRASASMGLINPNTLRASQRGSGASSGFPFAKSAARK